MENEQYTLLALGRYRASAIAVAADALKPLHIARLKPIVGPLLQVMPSPQVPNASISVSPDGVVAGAGLSMDALGCVPSSSAPVAERADTSSGRDEENVIVSLFGGAVDVIEGGQPLAAPLAADAEGGSGEGKVSVGGSGVAATGDCGEGGASVATASSAVFTAGSAAFVVDVDADAPIALPSAGSGESADAHSDALAAEGTGVVLGGEEAGVGEMQSSMQSPAVKADAAEPAISTGIGASLIVTSAPAHIWRNLTPHFSHFLLVKKRARPSGSKLQVSSARDSVILPSRRTADRSFNFFEASEQQPVRIIVLPAARAIMDLHSHMTGNEVIGLLFGAVRRARVLCAGGEVRCVDEVLVCGALPGHPDKAALAEVSHLPCFFSRRYADGNKK